MDPFQPTLPTNHAFLVQVCAQSVPRGLQGKPFVCPPELPPSRVEILSMFVAWPQAHPQAMGERPVDSLFRFLAEKWPCRR
jgi:hypothetical protein